MQKLILLFLYVLFFVGCKKNYSLISDKLTVQKDSLVNIHIDSVFFKPDTLLVCDSVKNFEKDKSLIQGNWSWLQEERRSRLFGTEYHTPLTEGYCLTKKFSNDTLYTIKNNVVVDTMKFSFGVFCQFTNFPLDTISILVTYDIPSGIRNHIVPYKFRQDTLVLQEQYVSSFYGEFTYKKIK